MKPRVRLVEQARVTNNKKIIVELLETLATYKKIKGWKICEKQKSQKKVIPQEQEPSRKGRENFFSSSLENNLL